ncbi:MAG: alginate export family protein, partial [Sphingobium phenoxybenzoativorans]
AGLNAHDEQIAIRTTLLAEYDAGGVRAGAELFDSRAYLSKAGGAISANEVNALELVQAYVAADLAAPFGPGSKVTVQLGRFTLNLGSRRLVAADDYRNTTNGYTGLRADFTAGDGTNGTFIYTLPQRRLPDDLASVLNNRVRVDTESFDLRLWGGVIARPRTIGDATAEISYFRLQERDSATRQTRDRNLHTVAARVIREPAPGKADYEVEGGYQFGTIRASLLPAAAQMDVSASFLHIDAGYMFPGPARLRLSLEYDYASGDGSGRRYGRFDTLYGMRRADLSPAGILAAIGRTNISTPGVRAEIAPSKRFDAFLSWRAMWLAARSDAFSTTGVRDPSGAAGRFAGYQAEGRLRLWLIPRFLRSELNAVWIAKGRFLRSAPNAPRTGDTRYLSLALTAAF